MKSRILLFILFIFSQGLVYGQVTNSYLEGRVTGSGTESLIGASVIAKHLPTGSMYSTITDENGYFGIFNMRSGGPYTIEVSYIGYQTSTLENNFLKLGEPFNLNVNLIEEGVNLDGVEIVGTRSGILNSNRTGAATNLSVEQLNTLPTISRSINDFTRLTPQAQSGNGFGGRDGRYNNIQIDGGNFNNNFGLSSSNLPGGAAQPISLDAIDQVQVNIAPYDVRQSNFTGAGINAITRSGSNTTTGSVYGYFRNQDFNGKYVGNDTVPPSSRTISQIFGARLGGAIIKDKLFYFVNYENEKNTRPGISFRPSAPGRSGNNVSRTTLADMDRVSQFVKNKYNYDTGANENYGDDFQSNNYKALARIDWNINDKHKLTMRYNQVVATDDQVVNGTSAPNPRSSSNRISQNSYAFENANYGFENSVRSLTAELNSTFSNKISNQFLFTYTKIEDKRTSKSSPFPFIDIKKDGDSYLSLGYELFSWKNEVINDVMTFTNNVTYKMGQHTLTGGVSFDYLAFQNSFVRYGTSYYRYSSVDDFINGATPEAFGLTYSLLPNGVEPKSELDFGLGGLYLQDDYRVSDKLKVTGGIRFDVPFYFNELQANPAISALDFVGADGTTPTKLDVSKWPTSKILFSPRVGFNYDALGDRSLQIRGGTGIFTGRVPFVWFTNMPTNSGTIQNTIELSGAAVGTAGIEFNADPLFHVGKFPSTPGASAPGSISAVDENFSMPQIWRTNLALDIKLPAKSVLTLEGLYSKDINAIVQYNANQAAPIGNMNANEGKDTRPFYGATDATRRINSKISEAIVLTNTDQGFSYSMTAQLTKEMTKSFSGMIAYTYTESKDLSGNPGSQAASAWSNNFSVRGQNSLDLDPSQFAVPHRAVGAITYKFINKDDLNTTVSLFYDGSSTGRFNYRYTADFNRDRINSDLIYIPNDPSEITFTDIKSGQNVLFTAQEQSDAFFAYVAQDDYLSANKGKYAERNGALMPWRNRFDLRLVKDLFNNMGGAKNTLQFSLDVLNIGNLINRDWGIVQTTNYSNGGILVPTVANDGTATFQMARVNNQLATQSFRNVVSSGTTWGLQVGLRFNF